MPGAGTPKATYSSFDLPSEHPAEDAAARLSYEAQDLPVAGVLKMYEQASGRTVIAGQLPNAQMSFRSATPLTRIEALQMLDTVLAQYHIAMVLSGDKTVKAVPAAAATAESPPEITLPWRLLPASSSMMSRTVRLQHIKPSHAVQVLQPLANRPNSILPIDSQGVLLLRDYSSNIRQQLKLLEELDQKQSISRPEAVQQPGASQVPGGRK
jgi:type II secretory pathway component GspD/PulD (secretin)